LRGKRKREIENVQISYHTWAFRVVFCAEFPVTEEELSLFLSKRQQCGSAFMNLIVQPLLGLKFCFGIFRDVAANNAIV
jgi:hypothetical protein